MKIRKFLPVYIITSIISYIPLHIIFQVKPTLAQNQISTYCGRNIYNIPTTIVDHPKVGKSYIIRWIYSVGGVEPLRRCEDFSYQLNLNLRKGNLVYIVEGRYDGRRALCASSRKTDSVKECSAESFLTDLQDYEDGQQIIQQIYDVNVNASDEGIYHSSSVLIRYEGYLHINFSKLFENAKSYSE